MTIYKWQFKIFGIQPKTVEISFEAESDDEAIATACRLHDRECSYAVADHKRTVQTDSALFRQIAYP